MSPTQNTMIWGSAPSTTCLKLWEFVSETENQNVLVLGVGDGRNVRFLATQSFKVVAVDPDPGTIDDLNEWAKAENIELSTFVAELDKIDLSGQFDIILCVGSLRNTSPESVGSFFSRIKAATRPMGCHAISVFVKKPFEGVSSDSGMFDSGSLMSFYGDSMILWTSQELYRGNGNDIYCVDRVIARVLPEGYKVDPDEVLLQIGLA